MLPSHFPQFCNISPQIFFKKTFQHGYKARRSQRRCLLLLLDVGEVIEFPFQQKRSSVGSSFLLASSIRRGTFPVMCSGPWRSSLRRQAPFLAVIAPEKASGGGEEESERQRFCGAKVGRNREPGPSRSPSCCAIPAEQPLGSRSWLWSLARTLPLAGGFSGRRRRLAKVQGVPGGPESRWGESPVGEHLSSCSLSCPPKRRG